MGEVASAALADGLLVGDSKPAGAGALHSGAKRESSGGNRDGLRRKVAVTAVLGMFKRVESRILSGGWMG